MPRCDLNKHVAHVFGKKRKNLFQLFGHMGSPYFFSKKRANNRFQRARHYSAAKLEKC